MNLKTILLLVTVQYQIWLPARLFISIYYTQTEFNHNQRFILPHRNFDHFWILDIKKEPGSDIIPSILLISCSFALSRLNMD